MIAVYGCYNMKGVHTSRQCWSIPCFSFSNLSSSMASSTAFCTKGRLHSNMLFSSSTTFMVYLGFLDKQSSSTLLAATVTIQIPKQNKLREVCILILEDFCVFFFPSEFCLFLSFYISKQKLYETLETNIFLSTSTCKTPFCWRHLVQKQKWRMSSSD